MEDRFPKADTKLPTSVVDFFQRLEEAASEDQTAEVVDDTEDIALTERDKEDGIFASLVLCQ